MNCCCRNFSTFCQNCRFGSDLRFGGAVWGVPSTPAPWYWADAQLKLRSLSSQVVAVASGSACFRPRLTRFPIRTQTRNTLGRPGSSGSAGGLRVRR